MPHALTRPTRFAVAALALGATIAAAGLAVAPTPASALSFTVTTTADVVDAGGCFGLSPAALPGPDGVVSLREAVCAANIAPGHDTIALPAGTYTLTGSAGEDFAVSGDLDVWDDPFMGGPVPGNGLTIVGDGADATIIDGGGADRIFEVTAFTPFVFELRGVTLRGGVADDGGAMITGFDAEVQLTDVVVSGNRAQDGGGIYLYGGEVTLFDTVIRDNEADGLGGGIYSAGVLRMQASTVAGNSAERGAGVAFVSSAGSDVSTIEQSTISGNTAVTTGGGIDVGPAYHGQTIVTDSTIVGNVAGADGGAIRAASSAVSDILVSSATITGNESPGIGGISHTAGFVTLEHSIVAENVGGDVGATVGGPGNIVGVAGASIVDGVNGNRAGSAAAPLDPRLRALGLYGGLTETRVPLPDSPAIDTGMSCGAVDQRWEPRPASAACDVGAVELTTAPDTAIASGPASLVASASATFAATASGGSAAYAYECDLGATGSYTACSAAPTVSGLLDGAHTMAIRAVDALGATDATPAVFNWTVDLTAPVLAWDAVSLGTVAGETSTLGFTASDANGVAVIECSLDGAAFAPCTSPLTTPSLGEGAHSFEVRATDTAGNVSAVLSRDWTVGAATTPPAPTTPAESEIADTGARGVGSALALVVMLLAGGALLVVVRRNASRVAQ